MTADRNDSKLNFLNKTSLSLTYENTDGKQRKNCIVKKLIALIGCATFPNKYSSLFLLLFIMR